MGKTHHAIMKTLAQLRQLYPEYDCYTDDQVLQLQETLYQLARLGLHWWFNHHQPQSTGSSPVGDGLGIDDIEN